jgi:hypothetical protein
MKGTKDEVKMVTMAGHLGQWRRSTLARRLALAPYALYRTLCSALPRRAPHVGGELFSMAEPTQRQEWIYHNEDWTRVRNRFEDRRRLRSGLMVTTVDNVQAWTPEATITPTGEIAFDLRTTTDDEWIYLHLDPRRYDWADFSWEFEVRRDTAFRELQFGFRYKDFYNRYRYRFEGDEVVFDICRDGKMVHGLNRAPLPMQLGRWYHVRIDAIDDCFRCFINGKLLLTDFDRRNSFPTGSIAIILWENDGKTDIRAAVRSLRVRRLE